MTKDAYRYWFSTYGRSWGVWFSYIAETIRSVINRIVGVVVLAGIVGAASAQDFARAEELIILWAILAIFSSVVSFAGELIGLDAENKTYTKQAVKFYEKLTAKDMAFYRDSHTGYLTASLRQHLDSAMFLSRMIRSTFISKFISLVLPIFVLGFESLALGLAAFVLVITQITYLMWASARANESRLESHKIYREISGEVTDDITNIVAYKSAGKEQQAFDRMKSLFKKETNTFWRRRSIVVKLNFPRALIISILAPLIFYIALKSASAGPENVEILVLTIFYVFQILRNLHDFPDVASRHDDIITKLVPTLDTLTNEYELIKDSSNTSKLTKPTGAIKFDRVGFHYDDDKKEVFKNFNLNIKPGEKVGIVGRSGAGKSTLASLLMRFDEVNEGMIVVDGVNIKDLSQSTLRQNIAYVPQEPLLFHRTVKQNIAYQIHATDSEILKAAKAAHAHEFIKDLTKGYETIVGERGVKLSGGQKQRIVIARAVLKKAPIILFDEATSALDSESEEIIQQALPEIIGNHTAIIIAHRLSTVAGLDRIIVLHNGKIEEQGTHAQLLKAGGRYAKLWAKQTKGKSF